MKKLLLYFSIILLPLLSTCKKDKDIFEININPIESITNLGAEKNSNITIVFSCTSNWTASINVDWAILSKTSGNAGNISLAIIAKEENNTGETRTGILKIKAGNTVKEIEFFQDDKITVNFEKDTFDVPAEGGEVIIKYYTNITDALLQIELEDGIEWINTNEQIQSKSLQQGSVTLNVLENELKDGRSAYLRLTFSDINNDVLFTSQSLTINQKGTGVGTSTNYTYDKQVTKLQSHTIGNGIPLVFMGDGFIDKEIESGFYEKSIRKGVEHFFTEEPVKSLKDYFDIWMIKAVSRNNAFGTGYTTCFNCRLEGNGSTLIEGTHEKVIEYAQVIPSLDINEATCIVILNTEEYAGTCYFGFYDEQTNNIINTAVGYCPMIYGIDNEMFRRVLVHECVGHGFAKLLDEYSYKEMGSIPLSEIQSIKEQQALGWGMNVDFTSDRTSVLWKDFLNDSRYYGTDNYGETLGVYEGACTYWSGAWRPTNESMMRSNVNGFNVPSRQAIYKRIMSVAYNEWSYDQEEFINFDLQHLPTPSRGGITTSRTKEEKPFYPPVFTKKHIKLQQ